jgi:hypothetical protein
MLVNSTLVLKIQTGELQKENMFLKEKIHAVGEVSHIQEVGDAGYEINSIFRGK